MLKLAKYGNQRVGLNHEIAARSLHLGMNYQAMCLPTKNDRAIDSFIFVSPAQFLLIHATSSAQSSCFYQPAIIKVYCCLRSDYDVQQ